ncbi:hypothetical protein [uncultured Roseibium sp.]|uniref:hypothetical protein n=1 Tax=uncultured Roseibium sp. TaxID=1936171 RepID=UPI0026026732|nr:hypothetical protein [uncultured Roseibium sp.]
MSTETLTKSTIVELSAIPEGSAVAAAVDGRSNIMALSQSTEDAVLKPLETGAWSHDIRAALAARIAALNGETALADRYCALIEDASIADLADPLRSGKAQGLEKTCDFMDKVAVQTRDVDAADIKALQDAGVSDADIVRLCEINAFMAYQVRVLAGIRLMKEGRA